jgi:hypothetical protein
MKNYVSGTFAADGQSTSILCASTALVFVGGAGGTTFGSGTVTVQFKGPDNQWYNSSETMTARDVKNITLTVPTEIRLDLSGSTAPDLDYAIQSDTTSYRD